MARRYSRSSYGRSRNTRRFPLGLVLVLGLCGLGLYLLIHGRGDGSPEVPEPGPQSGPVVSGPEVTPPGSADSPAQRALTDLLAELANDSSRTIELRDRLNAMLRQDTDAELAERIRKELSQLAGKWLFSAKPLPGDKLCATYQVQQGDLLTRIGQVNRVPWELLAQINRISNPRSLRLGQTIKVVRGPFHAYVSLADFRMDIYLQNTYVRSFPVGLARPGKTTPAGTWLVKDRIRDAAWTDPGTGLTLKPGDPNYPLGPVWMPLEGIAGEALGQPSYGIHGTNEPESIGTASSMGCVRLRNDDAEAVFNLLMPGHSRVVIAP